jgi:hypothetical protein
LHDERVTIRTVIPLRRATFTRSAVALALFATVAIVVNSSGPDSGRVVQAVGELGAGGEYFALNPERIFDSRVPELDVDPFGAKPMDTTANSSTFDVPIVGLGGLPEFSDENLDGNDDNVLAVAISIVVIAPDKLGFLRAFGKDAPEGTSSISNFFPGQFVPNMALVRPGADGKLTLRFVSPTGPGISHIAIDVFGWFSSSSYVSEEGGARVFPVGPGRVFDSRLPEFGAVRLGPRSVTTIPIRGAVSFDPTLDPIVPFDLNVVGALVNIGGINNGSQSRPTFISAVPGPLGLDEVPSTSNLNLLPGQIRSVMAIVPVGPDGSIQLFNLAGDVNVTVDVVGYMMKGEDPESRAGRVVPLVSSHRVLDTRAPDFFDQPLTPAGAEDWSFESFVNDVRIGDELVGSQLGLFGNLVATDLQRQYPWLSVASFLTAYPTPEGNGTAVPRVSNIVIAEGQTLPNMALLKYGSNELDPFCLDNHCVRFFNRTGYLDYILDVSAVILADELAPPE